MFYPVLLTNTFDALGIDSVSNAVAKCYFMLSVKTPLDQKRLVSRNPLSLPYGSVGQKNGRRILGELVDYKTTTNNHRHLRGPRDNVSSHVIHLGRSTYDINVGDSCPLYYCFLLSGRLGWRQTMGFFEICLTPPPCGFVEPFGPIVYFSCYDICEARLYEV